MRVLLVLVTFRGFGRQKRSRLSFERREDATTTLRCNFHSSTDVRVAFAREWRRFDSPSAQVVPQSGSKGKNHDFNLLFFRPFFPPAIIWIQRKYVQKSLKFWKLHVRKWRVRFPNMQHILLPSYLLKIKKSWLLWQLLNIFISFSEAQCSFFNCVFSVF